MSKLSQFDLPGNWQDFEPGLQRNRLKALWSASLNKWTQNGIAGGRAPLDDNRIFYYNPLDTDLSNAVEPGPIIPWSAFPNTILVSFPNAGPAEQLRYADEGPPGWSQIPGQGSYSPSGPRGYQDEYCEWSIRRCKSSNKITRVMFTCENPEYWKALWLIDPNKVLEVYQQLIGPQVKLEDLYVIRAGKKSYNPSNKWNSNTQSGAVHLVSSPNTLPAEIYLAAAATIVRSHDGAIVADKNQLIRCSQYGGVNRNSDPTIGSDVNTIIRGGGVKVSLRNPVGVYMQTPNFGSFSTPDGTDPSTFWKFVRGSTRSDPNGMDYGLHAVFEVPEELGYVVGDIRISGTKIQYGSQITQTFQIALQGLGIPSSDPNQTPRACIGNPQAAPVAAEESVEVDADDLREMMADSNVGSRH